MQQNSEFLGVSEASLQADHEQTAMKRGNITKNREVDFFHSWFDFLIHDQAVDMSNQPNGTV